MPEFSSSTYSAADGSNTSASPNGAPEGMPPSGVNDTIRALIGATKRFWQRIQGATASTGGTNAYELNLPDQVLANYVLGERYSFRASFANTGAATLAIDGLSATAIKKMGSSGKADLASGDIQNGQPVTVEYDGTHFVMVTPVAGDAVAAASETVAGKAEIATQAETDAGTDDARILTPLKLRDVAPATVTIDSANDLVLFKDFSDSNRLKKGLLPAAAASVPTGTVVPYAGSTEPTDWLFCYGQAISRTTYAALFAVISTTYGVGDGSTTFNLPDLRGRVAAGRDNMGGSAASRLTSTTMTADGNTLGATGGTQTHVLTTTEMPAHTHGDVLKAGFGSGPAGSADSFVGSTGSTGGGAAHLNVQPSIVLNYIIRT